MPTVIPKDQLKDYVGYQIGVEKWFTIDQQRINEFADATLDHQFIHVDPEKAKQTPFGTTIAHGFLTLSLLTHLASEAALLPEDLVMGINYGFDKVRFLNPVKQGQQVRARIVIADVEERDNNQMLVRQDVTVEINGEEKPALVAQWLTMYVFG